VGKLTAADAVARHTLSGLCEGGGGGGGDGGEGGDVNHPVLMLVDTAGCDMEEHCEVGRYKLRIQFINSLKARLVTTLVILRVSSERLVANVAFTFALCRYREEEGDSKDNPGEAAAVMACVRRLIRSGAVSPEDIGVITPYSAGLCKLNAVDP
jgi:hypothetical protein